MWKPIAESYVGLQAKDKARESTLPRLRVPQERARSGFILLGLKNLHKPRVSSSKAAGSSDSGVLG